MGRYFAHRQSKMRVKCYIYLKHYTELSRYVTLLSDCLVIVLRDFKLIRSG